MSTTRQHARSAGLHEVLGLTLPDGTAPGGAWTPAMAVLADAAARWMGGHLLPRDIAWIGHAVRPEPDAMPRAIDDTTLDLPSRSIVVTPHGRTSRFWAIERATRCTAIGCVIAEGTGADHVITRRLQVLAIQTRTLVLLARPATEQHDPSSAQSRWLVRRMPTTAPYPCWQIDLLRERFAVDITAGERWAATKTSASPTTLPLRAGKMIWTPQRTLAMRDHA